MDRRDVGELLQHLGFRSAGDGKRYRADLGGEGRKHAVSAKVSSTFTHLRVKSVFRLGEAPADSELLVRLMQLNQEMPVAKFCLDKNFNVHAIMTLPNSGLGDELINSALSLLQYYVRRVERKLGSLVRNVPSPAPAETARPRPEPAPEPSPEPAAEPSPAARPGPEAQPEPFRRPRRAFELGGTAPRKGSGRSTLVLRVSDLSREEQLRKVVLQSNAPRMQEMWRFDFDDSLIGVPAVYTDRALFASNEGAIYALSLRDGGPIWRFDCEGTPSSPVGQKRQFFCVVASTLIAADVRTGRRHWSAQQKASAHFSTPTLDAGRVLVGSVDGKLQCYDAQAGNLLWAYQCQASVLSPPVVQDELVYAVASDGHIYILQLENGKERARFMIPGGIESVGFFSPWIFAGAEGKRLVACDLGSRKPMWEVEVGCDVKSPLPPHVDEHRVYFGTALPDDNRLFVLDAATGKGLYEISTGSWSGTPLGAGKSLLLASDRAVYQVAADNGASRAVYTARGKITTGLALCRGRLMFGTEGGHAYCLQVES